MAVDPRDAALLAAIARVAAPHLETLANTPTGRLDRALGRVQASAALEALTGALADYLVLVDVTNKHPLFNLHNRMVRARHGA